MDFGQLVSKSFQITTYLDSKNNYIVSAKNVGTLVAGGEYQELATSGTSKEDSSNNMDGTLEIFFKNKPSNHISVNFKGGRVTSLLHARNQDIRKMQDEIDSIAYDFMNSVNAIHNKGFVNRPVELSPDGMAPQGDMKGPLTGIDFFTKPTKIENAALHIEISDEVLGDLSNIVTGIIPNGPGDNRVALAISKLQHERFLEGGTTTLEEKYLQMIGNVGIEAGKAKMDFDQSEGILAQTQTLRERISGVSIDEETANMVRFQHAYDASAKVMKTANEMFDTVLSIKR